MPADLDRVTAWVVTEPVGWIPADRYLAELAENMYRPEWTWIAEVGERVVGRALWWGPRDSAHPVALDCLDVDPAVGERTAIAAELIRRALAVFPRPVQYAIKVAGGWRADPATSAAVEWRRAAARAAGLTQEVERLQFKWTPADGVPTVGGALRFVEASDEEFLAVFARIAEGSLDFQTRTSVAAKGVDATAREEMDFDLGAPGKREWWRIAWTPEGEVAGMAIPSATPYSVNVGYLGVVHVSAGADTWTRYSARSPAYARPTERRASPPPPTWATRRWRPRSCVPVTATRKSGSTSPTTTSPKVLSPEAECHRRYLYKFLTGTPPNPEAQQCSSTSNRRSPLGRAHSVTSMATPGSLPEWPYRCRWRSRSAGESAHVTGPDIRQEPMRTERSANNSAARWALVP
ncbi:hypothetical protein [Nonomuraea sp. NPDC049684]|uniref:hypothetical protein n=1 Tax=Nonomuraea sp. NPDC049684 TaxID=3364356 RepID=UPI0037BCD5BF